MYRWDESGKKLKLFYESRVEEVSNFSAGRIYLAFFFTSHTPIPQLKPRGPICNLETHLVLTRVSDSGPLPVTRLHSI